LKRQNRVCHCVAVSPFANTKIRKKSVFSKQFREYIIFAKSGWQTARGFAGLTVKMLQANREINFFCYAEIAKPQSSITLRSVIVGN